jgi:hypothetical protein
MVERIVVDSEGQPQYAVEVDFVVSPLRGVPESVTSAIEGVSEVGKVIAQSSREVLDAMRDGLGELVPDEIELEFGVSIRGESGLPVIAKASGEANFKVRVCWKPSV